jgi:hypothetical protein
MLIRLLLAHVETASFNPVRSMSLVFDAAAIFASDLIRPDGSEEKSKPPTPGCHLHATPYLG